MLSKRQTVVLLRWVLIIAFSYLLLLNASTRHLQARVVLVIAAALASNLVIGRLPDRWLEHAVFDFAVVLYDAAWVTLGLLWAPNASSDLFLLYFLVIFVASVGESLPMIVGSAVLVSLVYGAMLSMHGAGLRVTSTELLRVPFLFVVALFYGYFVTEIRGRRSEAMEARLRDQAKSELLAAVSHDLRGPLGNAEGLLSLLLDDAADEEPASPRALLLRVQVNVRCVSALVANLLQAACIKAGQVHLQRAPVQLNDVVDDVLTLEAGAAQLKAVTLSKEIDPQLPVVTADLVQMGRVLTNLVSNAIKYTESGGRVVVRTVRTADSVRLLVEDNGPGMSAAQCREVFAPYRRVHLGGSAPGAGLGLYIVKQLVEAQGGTVSVGSRQGEGSTFSVSFPAVPVAAPMSHSGEAVDGALPVPAQRRPAPAGFGM